MFGTNAKAYHYKVAADDDDSDTEDLQRLVWGMTIQEDSSSDEDSDRSSQTDSDSPSIPPDGQSQYYNVCLPFKLTFSYQLMNFLTMYFKKLSYIYYNKCFL